MLAIFYAADTVTRSAATPLRMLCLSSRLIDACATIADADAAAAVHAAADVL